MSKFMQPTYAAGDIGDHSTNQFLATHHNVFSIFYLD